jgi:type I restriction enzyme S subunit
MKTLVLNSREFARNDNRLRGSSYSLEAYAARRRLKRSGFPLVPLGNQQVTGQIFIPPRFKRIFVTDKDHGVPYVTSAEMLFAAPPRDRFLSKKLTKVLPSLIVREGWTLIADSGTVGNCVIVTSDLDGYAVTNNAVRVIAANGFGSGYLYAYVSSNEFQAQITEQIYGSVIDHIEAQHVANIAIPRLPDDAEQRIHELVMTACDLRVQANVKLTQADEQFHQINNLPRLPKGPIGSEHGAVSNRLFLQNPEAMLIASHYNKLALRAGKNIARLRDRKRIAEIATVYMPTRFKRVRVQSDYGIPFLTGKHILQLEPTDYTYISEKLTRDLESYIVHQAWTLITRSGTVGRTAFVSQDLDDAAVTEDAIRVIPSDQIHPGYLYAFLASSYGYLQVTRYVHGSVIPHISEAHIERALLPFPSRGARNAIGELVLDAMGMRVRANALLRRARALFDATLTAGQDAFAETDAADWLALWERSAEGAQE